MDSACDFVPLHQQTFLTSMTEDVKYNFRENNSLALPKTRASLPGIDTIRFIRKEIMADTTNRIRRIPTTRDFQAKD